MANSNVTKSFSLSLMSPDALMNEIDLLVLLAFISTLHLQNFTSRYFDMVEDNLWIKTSNELLMKAYFSHLHFIQQGRTGDLN